MQTKDAYNNWASTYDTVDNKTRDLEGKAIRSVLAERSFGRILELGCGTGKNTSWLAERCSRLTAVDFSTEMLQLAQEKVTAENVCFKQADITENWPFEKVDLITCSLVLEHIEDLAFVFRQAEQILDQGGQFYVCELHPFKQLQGSRAKFEKEGELLQLEYFIHHISDFFDSARELGFECVNLQEWFDNDDRSQTPRLVSFLFRR